MELPTPNKGTNAVRSKCGDHENGVAEFLSSSGSG
jgi:hypothetical protein